ncbi:MAG: hypothetical protein NTU48_08485 [Legionellales bacterium]|nr:hypothetical protein [Legionellales bacterium]
MKTLILALVLATSCALVTGCCEDMSTGLDTSKCEGCSTCTSCGYGSTYTDSGWY